MSAPPHPSEGLGLWSLTADGTLVTTQGCYLRAYALTGIDSEHVAGDVLFEAARQLYEDARQDLPDDAFVQFVLEGHGDYSEVFEAFERTPPPEDRVLAHQRARRLEFLKASNLRRFETVVAVGTRRGLSTREFAAFRPEVHQARTEAAKALGRSVVAMLARAGVSTRPLSSEGLRSVYYRALNPGRGLPISEGEGVAAGPTLGKLRPSLAPRSLRERLMESPMTFTDDAVRVGRRYHKVLTLRGLPASTAFTKMEAFLQLPFDFRLSVCLSVPPQDAAETAFKLGRRVAHADAHRSPHVADEGRLGLLQEANLLAETLAATKQKLVLVSLQVVVFGRSERETEASAEAVAEYLRRFGFGFVEETGRHERELLKTLPGMGVTSDRYKMVTSNNAVDLMPLFGGHPGDRNPALLMATARGELFGFNPVEPMRDNWNACVFGASGAGKSVFMNMLITSGMLAHERGRLLVVDFAGETKSSYRMVAELFGGTFLPLLGERSDIALNPFPPPRQALDEKGRLKGETLHFLIVLTDLLLANHDLGMEGQLYRTVLQRALAETYRGRTEDADTPVYADLARALGQISADSETEAERVHVLSKLLGGFLEAPEARLFNRPSKLGFDSPFLIFDLFGIDALPVHLREALTFQVCHAVRRLAFDAKDDGVKYVVLDEVAQLLRRDAMKALVHELYSTARKHRTSIWSVTQKYSDYVQSAVAGTIKLNSTTHLFLSHARAADARRQIAADFELNPREEALFESLVTRKGLHSEALLRTEVYDEASAEKRAISAKVRLALSPFDYELSTSDAADRALQRKVLAAHPGRPLVEVLDALAQWKATRDRGGKGRAA